MPMTNLLILGKVAEEATVISVKKTKGLCQVVVLQRGEVIVLDSQGAAGLDQEVIVQPLVVQVVADGR